MLEAIHTLGIVLMVVGAIGFCITIGSIVDKCRSKTEKKKEKYS